MLKKIPILLLILIALIAIGNQHISLPIKSFAFALALSIKAILVFSLPLLIFLLIFKTISELAQGATKLIFIILLCVVLSNFTSTFTSFCMGKILHGLDISMTFPEKKNELMPLWSFCLPSLLPNSLALFLGALMGMISHWIAPSVRCKMNQAADRVVSSLLKGFVLMIPLFVIGFIMKLAHDQILYTMIKEYGLIFVMIALAQVSYIFLLYMLINGLKIKKALSSIKNMLAAATVGFGAMSSAAAMPLTLIGSEKNAKHGDIARSCIPATVSIHLIGDCLAIPLFAFAVLKNFSMPLPSIEAYAIFALYFVLAKFSVAAIPGGGIIVMLPILEKHMGFTPEMLSLITALYILFDPVITFTNVLGNGAFAQGIDKLYSLTWKPSAQMTK